LPPTKQKHKKLVAEVGQAVELGKLLLQCRFSGLHYPLINSRISAPSSDSRVSALGEVQCVVCCVCSIWHAPQTHPGAPPPSRWCIALAMPLCHTACRAPGCGASPRGNADGERGRGEWAACWSCCFNPASLREEETTLKGMERLLLLRDSDRHLRSISTL
jgi:hypothetical protein